MGGASHFITDLDRTDAHWVRRAGGPARHAGSTPGRPATR
jgi:hypothetical protein